MKKSIKITILGIAFFAIIALFCKSEAASASISASSTNVNVGDSVSIKININAAAWDLKVSGVVSGAYADTTSDGNNQSKTETLTYKTTSAGTFKVSLSGNVSDGATNQTSNVSDSVSITVSQKTTPTPTKTPTKTPTPTPSKTVTPTPANKQENFKTVNEIVIPTTDGVNVRKSNSTSSDSIGKLNAGEEVTRIAIGSEWSKIKFNGGTGYVRNDMITVKKDSDKTSDKALKSLVVDGYDLSPDFNPEITDYDVVVDESVEKIDVKAVPNDEKAKVVISGNDRINSTDSLVKITVTAQDGTTRIYKLNVSKKIPTEEFGLSVLKVNGYSLSPKFKTDVFEYKLNVSDSNVNQLNIIATANKENAEVIIEGNENLQAGDNLIKIIVKSKDSTESAEYKITVSKQAQVIAGTTGNNGANTPKNGGDGIVYIGIVLVVFFGVMGFLVFASRKNKKKSYSKVNKDYDEYNDEGLYGNLDKEDESFFDESIYGNKYGVSPAYQTFDIAKEYGDEVDNNTDVYGYKSFDNSNNNIDVYNANNTETKKDSIINKYFPDSTISDNLGYQMDSIGNNVGSTNMNNVDNNIGNIYGLNNSFYEEEEHIGFGHKSYDKSFEGVGYNNIDEEVVIDLDGLDEVEDVNLDFSNSIQDAISSYENNIGSNSSVYAKYDNVKGSSIENNVFGNVGMNFNSVFDKKDEVKSEKINFNKSRNYEDDFEELFNSKFNSMQSSIEKSYKSIYDDDNAVPFDQGLQIVNDEDESTQRRARGRHSK